MDSKTEFLSKEECDALCDSIFAMLTDLPNKRKNKIDTHKMFDLVSDVRAGNITSKAIAKSEFNRIVKESDNG